MLHRVSLQTVVTFVFLILFLSQSVSYAQSLYWAASPIVYKGDISMSSGHTLNRTNVGIGFIPTRLMAVNNHTTNLIYVASNETLYDVNFESGVSVGSIYEFPNMAHFSSMAYSRAGELIVGAGVEDYPGAFAIDVYSGVLSRIDANGEGYRHFVSVTVDDADERIFFADPQAGVYVTSISDDNLVLLAGTVPGANREIRAIHYDEYQYYLYITYYNYDTFMYDVVRKNLNPTPTGEPDNVVMVSSNIEITAMCSYGLIKSFYYAANNKIYHIDTQTLLRTEVVSESQPITAISILFDKNNPQLESISPSNAEVGVSVTTSLSLTFNEPVTLFPSVATFQIYRVQDDYLAATYNRNSSNVSVQNNTVTIQNVLLEPNTSYYVLVGLPFISDLAYNYYSGISDKTSWTFTTGDLVFYSRSSGNWDDLSTWSFTSDGLTPATILPNSQSIVYVQPSHTVTSTNNITAYKLYVQGTLTLREEDNLIIQGGADGAHAGLLNISGTLTLPGKLEVIGDFVDLRHSLTKPFVIPYYTSTGGVAARAFNHFVIENTPTGLVPVQQPGGSVCLAYNFTVPTVTITAKTANLVTLSWVNTSSDQTFIIAREKSTERVYPAYGTTYTGGNVNFGLGSVIGDDNYVVYAGITTSFNLMSLSAGTEYELDIYKMSLLGGGCYSNPVSQTLSFSTCINTAPIRVGSNKSICSPEEAVDIEVEEAPNGFYVGWFAAASGNTYAIGYVHNPSNKFTPEITSSGTFNYWASYMDYDGFCSSPRTSTTVTVHSTVQATEYETDVIICSPIASLSSGAVTGGSAPYTYQWQYASTLNGTFQDISAGGNSAIYTSSNMDAGYYRRIVRHAAGACEVIQDPISLSIGSVPVITQQPVNAQVCDGASATFSVTATGSNLSYQWINNDDVFLIDGDVYKDVTSSTLIIEDVSEVSLPIGFFCNITNAEGCSVKSSLVTVQVTPQITATGNALEDILKCDGVAPTLQAENLIGGNGTFQYQWQIASSPTGTFTNIVGAVSATYTPSSNLGINYYKRNVVSGNCSFSGEVVEVKIGKLPTIYVQPTDQSVCESSIGTIMVTAESLPSNQTQWFIYNSSGNHQAIDSAPYLDYNSHDLVIQNTAGLDGTKYFLRIDNHGCTLDSDVVTINVTQSISLQNTSQDAMVCDGNFPTLTAGTVSGGTGSYTYQWYSAENVGGTNQSIVNTNSATYTPSGLVADTYFRVQVNSGACSVYSNYIKVSIEGISPIITSHPLSLTRCETETASFTVQASGSSLSYSWYAVLAGVEEPLSSSPYSGYSTNSLTVSDLTDLSTIEYFCEVKQAGGCAVRSNVATLTVHQSIEVNGTITQDQSVCSGEIFPLLNGGNALGGNGTYLFQWESSSSSAGPFVGINGANGGTYSPTGFSSTTFFRRTIESGVCSYQGNPIQITVVNAPTITINPSSVSKCEGETATFSMGATGSSLMYQWYSFDGATETALTGNPFVGYATNQLSFITNNDLTGLEFFCKVSTDGACELKTANASLTVNALPTAVPQSATFCETNAGDGSATVNLTNFDSSVSGGLANRAVTWYADQTTMIVNPIAATATNNTVFLARVTNTQNSCFSQTTHTITINGRPSVVTPTTKFLCDGEETDLSFTSSLPNTTYNWTIEGGSGISGASAGSGTSINQVLKNNTTSIQGITYVIVPIVGTCEGNSFQQELQVDIALQLHNLTGEGSFCANTAGALLQMSDRQANVKYELYYNGNVVSEINPGAASLYFAPQQVAGEYSAVAVSSNNCRKQMNGVVTVTELVAPFGGEIEINDQQTLCVGDQVVLHATSFDANPNNYAWTLPSHLQEVSRNANAITVLIKSEGNGDVIVKALNNCGESQPVNSSLSFYNVPTVSIDAIPRILVGDEVSFSFTALETISDVVWRFSDNQVFTSTSPILVWESPGSYEAVVEVSNSIGCVGVDRLSFDVHSSLINEYSIKNVITPNGDGENDYLTIVDIERFEDTEVLLYDRWGNLVFQKKAYQNDWDLRKGSEYLPAGSYLCIVRYEGKTYSRTITVLKGI